MKNTIALALGGLALALGACAAPETPDSALKPPTSQTSQMNIQEIIEPVVPDNVVKEDQLDDILASVMEPEGFYLEDGQYYQYAVLVCEGLNDGLAPMSIALIAEESFGRYSLEQHATMVGASVGGLCPEHSDKILSYY